MESQLETQITFPVQKEPSKPSRKIWGYIFLALIFVAAVAGVYWWQTRDQSVEVGSNSEPPVKIFYEINDENFNNPERGFHGNVNLTPDTNYDELSKQYSLLRAYVRLDEFRDKPLSESFLGDLDQSLEKLKTGGLKVVIRFAYNFGPIGAPDAPKEVILSHINQLKPLFEKHADVIAVVQAGFVGTWGEWHNSTNGLDNDRDHFDIAAALLDALPETRMIQVRTPYWKAGMYNNYNAVTAAESYNNSYRARTGQHNDCFLTSEDDTGTYNRPFGPNPEHGAPNDIEAWKNFTAADTAYTPMGGETCQAERQRSTCSTALAELKQTHWSYLNADFYQPVLDAWKVNGCYDEITKRLGYRLELVNAEFSQQLPAGSTLELTAELKNTGWAAPYNPRPLYVVLTNGIHRSQNQVAVDPRRWNPGTDSSFTAKFQIPSDFPAGTYDLAIWLPDYYENLQGDPRYSIRFANNGVWDGNQGHNKLGTVKIVK